MIRVRTQDGAEFLGSNEKEIVRQMRNTQWNAPTAKRDYICEVIDRVEASTGKMCPNIEDRAVTAREFVQFLTDSGMIEVETVEPEKVVDSAR